MLVCWFSFMNAANLYAYVPIRTYGDIGDAADEAAEIGC
jgi:hypothetical protein